MSVQQNLNDKEITSFKKVGENYFFNTLLTIFVSLFPIITFPYVSRILGPTGLGKVTFAYSLANYFIIIVSLGLPYYGLREISKSRDNQETLNDKFSEFLSQNLVALVVFGLLYLFIISFISKFRQDEALYLITGVAIVLSVFQVQWFYQGLEKFRFIAIVNIAMQFIAIILIFTFIKTEHDYVLYAITLLIAFFGSSILNLIYSRKYVHFRFQLRIKLEDYKPFIYLYIYILVMNIYLNLDKVILGFIAGDKYVGYYSPANQIIKMVSVFVTSISTVLLPRISSYIKEQNEKEIALLSKNSLNFILMFAIPAAVGIAILAPEIIFLFSGPKFSESVLALQLMVPVIVFTGISNFLVLLILIPRHQDKELVLTTLLGSIIDVLLNILFVPSLDHIGTALAILLTEIVVSVSQIFVTRKYFAEGLFSKNIWNYVIGSSLIGITIFLVKVVFNSPLLVLFVGIGLSLLVYFIYLLITKDQIFYNIILSIKPALFQ